MFFVVLADFNVFIIKLKFVDFIGMKIIVNQKYQVWLWTEICFYFKKKK